jgi:hypothetical protein
MLRLIWWLLFGVDLFGEDPPRPPKWWVVKSELDRKSFLVDIKPDPDSYELTTGPFRNRDLAEYLMQIRNEITADTDDGKRYWIVQEKFDDGSENDFSDFFVIDGTSDNPPNTDGFSYCAGPFRERFLAFQAIKAMNCDQKTKTESTSPSDSQEQATGSQAAE